MQQSYTPSDKILKKYADVLVDVGLGKAKGIKKGDTVWLNFPEVAKPLLYWTYRKVLERGGHPIIDLKPSATEKYKFEQTYYELAKPHQLKHLENLPRLEMMKKVDHRLSVIGETDKTELASTNPQKISTKQVAQAPIIDTYFTRLANYDMTRTVGLYGTDQMAAEAGLTPRQYWNQIIKACHLRKDDPVKIWRKFIKDMKKISGGLTKLSIDSVHVESKNVDLHVGIGADREWISADGDNIPSFEVFTSPDWRRVNGKMSFDVPLYANGNVVRDISLEFKDGEVIKATASKGEQFLRKLLKTDKGASRVGEFSLTDKRYSPINKFMAETLYDENFGGRYGNTHIALGNAYKDCIKEDQTTLSTDDFDKKGFNTSSIHEDMFSTENRRVTATLDDGTKKVIYQNGQFTI